MAEYLRVYGDTDSDVSDESLYRLPSAISRGISEQEIGDNPYENGEIGGEEMQEVEDKTFVERALKAKLSEPEDVRVEGLIGMNEVFHIEPISTINSSTSTAPSAVLSTTGGAGIHTPPGKFQVHYKSQDAQPILSVVSLPDSHFLIFPKVGRVELIKNRETVQFSSYHLKQGMKGYSNSSRNVVRWSDSRVYFLNEDNEIVEMRITHTPPALMFDERVIFEEGNVADFAVEGIGPERILVLLHRGMIRWSDDAKDGVNVKGAIPSVDNWTTVGRCPNGKFITSGFSSKDKANYFLLVHPKPLKLLTTLSVPTPSSYGIPLA